MISRVICNYLYRKFCSENLLLSRCNEWRDFENSSRVLGQTLLNSDRESNIIIEATNKI